MKIRQFLTNLRKVSSKKLLLAVVLGTAISGVAINAVHAEFYPDRPTYDYNKECNPNDNDPFDRCGSLDGPVFNSFINTPYYGDERQFADAKRTDQTSGDVYKNVLPDVTDGAKEVKIRVYVHNNANSALNASGKGVAKNTMVKIGLPTGSDSEMRARGYISADNAPMVEDTVDFTATKKFHMEYVPGSAMLYNNSAFKDGKQLSDSIVTTGALIGDDALDGDLPGCFDFQATVFITVKIVPEEAPKVTFNKLVKSDAQGADWSETTTVKPGEKVNWLVEFANAGNQDLNEVTINDNLPPHVRVVPGSVRYIDAGQDVVQSDNTFFTTGGIGFGTWKPNGGFYVRFQTEALSDFDPCEVTVRNVAYYKTKEASGEDYADLTIKKTNCNQPQTPSVVCTSLDVPSLSLKKGAHTTLTAKSAATNAIVNGYIFKVIGNVVKETNSSTDNTYDFTQSSTGTYQVSVDVKSSLGTITSDACKKTITVTEETPAPVYACESFTLSKNTVKVNEKFKANVKVTAQNGAQFKLATFTFGDEGNGEKFVTNAITDNTVSAEHAYSKEGDYAPRVKLEFTVNGETKVVEDSKCAAQIKVEKQVLATTTSLPATGATDVAGILSAVTIVGAFTHRRSTLKKRANR